MPCHQFINRIRNANNEHRYVGTFVGEQFYSIGNKDACALVCEPIKFIDDKNWNVSFRELFEFKQHIVWRNGFPGILI